MAYVFVSANLVHVFSSEDHDCSHFHRNPNPSSQPERIYPIEFHKSSVYSNYRTERGSNGHGITDAARLATTFPQPDAAHDHQPKSRRSQDAYIIHSQGKTRNTFESRFFLVLIDLPQDTDWPKEVTHDVQALIDTMGTLPDLSKIPADETQIRTELKVSIKLLIK